MRALIVIAFLTGLAMAGCIGGDDDVDADDAPAGSNATTGGISGRVVDGAFDPVANADVLLMDQGGAKNIKNTTTNPEGFYSFKNIEPGEYRVLVEALCCFANQKTVTVVAGENAEADVQLELAPDPRDAVRVDTDGEWTGFVSCSLSNSYSQTPAQCTTDSMDPNRDYIHDFEGDAGLKTIVVAMVWDQAPTNTEDNLRNWLWWWEEEDDDEGTWQSMARHRAPSPMLFRFDYDEPLEEPREYQFRIYAGANTVVPSNTGLTLQQPFTVYWHLFYGEPAPEGYSARPDV